MEQYTQQTIDAILARDASERAGMGGMGRCLSTKVRGIPTGKIHGHNANPGPLDGKPEHRWVLDCHYEDGRIVTIG